MDSPIARVKIYQNQHRWNRRFRPTAIGKKNWLFIGRDQAGWRSAVIYAPIVSCRNHGMDPYAYLKDVLTRLPNMTNQQIHLLTPKAWAAAKAKEETIAQAA